MKSDPADVDGELGGLQREAVNILRGAARSYCQVTILLAGFYTSSASSSLASTRYFTVPSAARVDRRTFNPSLAALGRLHIELPRFMPVLWTF
ncbi:hypothetical protein VTN49DRAFT_5536 [Thermomyces lanuginosus]|uniref:uncharacterized protein n=1 Tax=Thermomyces lanuginosus TaxID=5541 RepID=UPI003742F3BB